MNKSELRKQIREKKTATDADAFARMSQSVCRSVVETRMWKDAKVVLLYMSLADEVDTKMLREIAISEGKTVLLPTCVGDDLVLRIYEGENRMKAGAYGIMEPTGSVYEEDRYGDIDLAIIPGMAFDKDGGRLGRGRGFYDRLLPKLGGCRKMGICWDFQLVDNVPKEEHDVAMDLIIHE